MFRIQIAVLVFLVMLGSMSAASAFSTEKPGNVIKGDPSNFTDPDEQKPAFLQPSGDQSSQQLQSSPSAPVDREARREKLMELSPGYLSGSSQK